ncbi:unnamed protein product [Darwinula stevensoni]|uniref:Bromo domain-containing protein n=1 Tax=Darwinula stevensoni TaxID=69355 RepID=A0A7R8XF52_9CRUS|nr:unnamed protein product [Darwinula stevensoni]CAG0894638.1 unnamed protein product [Darwinula stevensoni]
MGSKKHKRHRGEGGATPDHEVSIDDPPTMTAETSETRLPGLKLILKVGSGGSATPERVASPMPGLSHHSHHDEHHSHKKKEKKKKKKKEKDRDKERHKHKHHHRDREHHRKRDYNIERLEEERRSLTPTGVVENVSGNVSTTSSIRGPSSPGAISNTSGGDRPIRTCVLKKQKERKPLNDLLEYLLKCFEKKDPQQFFAWPVTDNIAPGYSSIITHPMDFSSMRGKIVGNEYTSLDDFRSDLDLVCRNAQTYNHPETVYFKAAKKLQHYAHKLMSKEKLTSLRTELPCLVEIPASELGFVVKPPTPPPMLGEPMDTTEVVLAENAMKTEESASANDEVTEKREGSRKRTYSDDLTPEEIYTLAQAASQGACEQLTMRKANAKLSFLRQRDDGTTTLNVVCPTVGEERPVNLGMLTNKLSQGLGSIAGFREDKRNLLKTVKPLYYGPFCSHGPSYDSQFANVSLEESQLLLSTYADESALQYAESIMKFAEDTDYTLNIANNLLDSLTDGDHSAIRATLLVGKEGSKGKDTVADIYQQDTDENNDIDFDSIRSLESMGIDVSFLNEMQETMKKELELQKGLDENAKTLKELHEMQHTRLSLPLPQHLSNVVVASDQEHALAEQVVNNLGGMLQQVPPGSVTPLVSIRKAMGIGMQMQRPVNNDLVDELDKLIGEAAQNAA